MGVLTEVLMIDRLLEGSWLSYMHDCLIEGTQSWRSSKSPEGRHTNMHALHRYSLIFYSHWICLNLHYATFHTRYKSLVHADEKLSFTASVPSPQTQLDPSQV